MLLPSVAHLLFLFFFLYVLNSHCKIQHIHTCVCIHMECTSTCNANIGLFKKNERGEKEAPGVIYDDGGQFFPKTHLI